MKHSYTSLIKCNVIKNNLQTGYGKNIKTCGRTKILFM